MKPIHHPNTESRTQLELRERINIWVNRQQSIITSEERYHNRWLYLIRTIYMIGAGFFFAGLIVGLVSPATRRVFWGIALVALIVAVVVTTVAVRHLQQTTWDQVDASTYLIKILSSNLLNEAVDIPDLPIGLRAKIRPLSDSEPQRSSPVSPENQTSRSSQSGPEPIPDRAQLLNLILDLNRLELRDFSPEQLNELYRLIGIDDDSSAS